MRCPLTVIVGVDTRLECIGTQQPVCFGHGPLVMDPFRLDRIEPRTFAGQPADHAPHPDSTPLDLLMVLPDPVPHCLTAVPGRVIPEQQPGGEALGSEP